MDGINSLTACSIMLFRDVMQFFAEIYCLSLWQQVPVKHQYPSIMQYSVTYQMSLIITDHFCEVIQLNSCQFLKKDLCSIV
jgi:hypothetical protein